MLQLVLVLSVVSVVAVVSIFVVILVFLRKKELEETITHRNEAK